MRRCWNWSALGLWVSSGEELRRGILGYYAPLCPACRSCSKEVAAPSTTCGCALSSSRIRLSSSNNPSLPQYSAFSVPLTQPSVISTYGIGASNIGSARTRSISTTTSEVSLAPHEKVSETSERGYGTSTLLNHIGVEEGTKNCKLLRPRAPVSFFAALSAMPCNARWVKASLLGYVSNSEVYCATRLFLGSLRIL